MKFSRGEIVNIPGAIDVHTHLREPGSPQKETIASGTLAALYGGYVLVCDMPNNLGGTPEDPKANQTLSAERVLEKHHIAKETAYTDVAIIGGHDFQNPRLGNYSGMMGLIVADKGYKGHTTGNVHELTIDDPDVWSCYLASDAAAKEKGYRLPHMLHAREEVGYEAARRIMKELQAPAHWCHISTSTEVDYVEKLIKEFPDLFFSEVTPHHLLMTGRNATYINGWMGRAVPPLGSEVDQDKLLWAYNRRILKIIGTDHAPHATEEKMEPEAENPMGHTDVDCSTCFGMSGIEFAIPMLTRLVQQEIITMETLVDSLHTQPLRMLGLEHRYKNSETTLEFEPWQITESSLKGRSSNTPYLGGVASSRVVSVKVNGVDRMRQTRPDIEVVLPERIAT